ncbi:hypothetical protein HDK77DRAFT_121785 [Phyllosticta capitalensis]
MVPWRMTKKGRLGHLGAKNKTGTATDPHTKMEAMPRHTVRAVPSNFTISPHVIQKSFSPNSSPASVSKKNSESFQPCYQPSWISATFWKCPLSWNQPLSRETPWGLASALSPKFGDVSFDALQALQMVCSHAFHDAQVHERADCGDEEHIHPHVHVNSVSELLFRMTAMHLRECAAPTRSMRIHDINERGAVIAGIHINSVVVDADVCSEVHVFFWRKGEPKLI